MVKGPSGVLKVKVTGEGGVRNLPVLDCTVSEHFHRGQVKHFLHQLNEDHWGLLEKGAIGLFDLLIVMFKNGERAAHQSPDPEGMQRLCELASALLEQNFDNLIRVSRPYNEKLLYLFRKNAGG